MRKYLAILCVLAVSACSAHTSVQGGYNNDRDQCQTMSELKLPLYEQEMGELDIKQRNAKLVTLFSNCMFDNGWTVATPSRAGDAGFKADPGVGVGASVRPGRFSDTVSQDARRAFDDSASEGVPQTWQPRKTPIENIEP